MRLALADLYARALRDHAALERFAVRRQRFLEALDWPALGDQFARATSMADDHIIGDLADAWLYVCHLAARLVAEAPGTDTPQPVDHSRREKRRAGKKRVRTGGPWRH